jgi:hypothetical protein
VVDLDFSFGGNMRSHLYPITLSRWLRRERSEPRSRGSVQFRWLRLLRGCSVCLAHLMRMNITHLGLEPLIGVDVTVTPALMRISGTVISDKGQPTFRQDHPKTDRSNRIVALPSFTSEALRKRLAVMADRSPEALVFASRNGTPLTTTNVRRQLRKVLGGEGIEGVSPHMFRRNEHVNPLTAELLDEAFAPDADPTE